MHSPHRRPLALAIVAALGLAAGEAAAQKVATEKGAVRVDTVAQGLENPWSLAFLPDGRMLVTERPGRLRIVAPDGRLSRPVAGVPDVVAQNQGGLLDVAIDPRFAENGLVYLSFSEPRGAVNGTAVARGKLVLDGDGGRLEDVKIVFRQEPGVSGGHHFGSRLAFAPDGNLFVTLGDRFAHRDRAQTLDNHFGKVVRIRPDGSVPPDNPFVDRTGAKPEIWSYGHRNPQAAAVDPATGKLWIVEHGARGGDEVNISEPGKNYGWPVITYGRDYSGAKIGEGTAKPGLEQPVHHWDPSIAPSGMAFYTGDRAPGWKGSLFVGALAGKHLVRLELDGGKIVREERLLTGLGERIRDVRQGPDGFLYVVTDAPRGRILRLTPEPGQG